MAVNGTLLKSEVFRQIVPHLVAVRELSAGGRRCQTRYRDGGGWHLVLGESPKTKTIKFDFIRCSQVLDYDRAHNRLQLANLNP